jgi:hypothetical protein
MKVYGSTAAKRESDEDHKADHSSRVIYELEGEQASLLSHEGSSSHDDSNNKNNQSGRARASGFAAVGLCVLLATLGYSSKSSTRPDLLRSFSNTSEMIESVPNAFTSGEPEYELFPAGEGGGSCPDGQTVSREACYAAASKVGVAAGLTINNPTLTVGTWDYMPCGCFIWDNAWIDYKDPSFESCKAPRKAALVCEKPLPPMKGGEGELALDEIELLNQGEGGGSCPAGQSITMEECYAAASKAGDAAGLTINNPTLTVGTWDYMPCGCFIWDNGWIDYKDPSAGNCKAPLKAALVCQAEKPAALAAVELYPPGEGNGKCHNRKAISQDQCLEAATKVGKEAGMTELKEFLNVGKWTFTPCGCFIYDNSWIDYKDPGAGNCKADPKSQLVCLEEDPMPVDPNQEESSYELLGAGEGDGICPPHGMPVSKDDCLQAAHDVGGVEGLTNLYDFLNVGTWPFTPCGCFIYLDEWVDYKDPSLGNCKPDPNAKLVCRRKKPLDCTPPDNHPCATDDCKHTCIIKPDPHYLTWSNNKYDFQGGCDQIAIDNCHLQVQIRTRPLLGYSTITEVVILFKATDETFTYKMNFPAGSGYTSSNDLTAASVSSLDPVGNGYKLVINESNHIVVKGGGVWGIIFEVQGGGGYMHGSVGMCGSWDHGYARFKDDTKFDTSGGYRGTRDKSIALAKDWQVPLESSLLTDPSDICDSSSSCGEGSAFECIDPPDPPGPGPAFPDCEETNCDKVTPAERREACEEDIATTGDTSWACKYIEESSMPVITPSPNQFIPAPTDSSGSSAPTPAPTNCESPDTAMTSCGCSAKSCITKCGGTQTEEVAGSSEKAVRCCSDTKKDGWIKNSKCSVWSFSGIGGKCDKAATFCEAEDICESVGARLCTVAELEGNCASGSGCNFNNEMSWASGPAPTPAPTMKPTSQPTAAPTAAPTPAPTSPPTAKPTRSPTQINHPCGTDACQHTCVIRPDPHYQTWSNNQYDFQGGCDQIAIDNGNLQVQIRTRPRGHYSTITEVAVLFKITRETFIYKMNHKSNGGGYTAVNRLTSESCSSVQPFGNGYTININSKNLIRVSGGGIGITLEVRGGGGFMFDSVGMCGAWNNGYARFKNGRIFNTRGGYSGTRSTSIALARDWQVPKASSILTNPSDICDASAACGPGRLFACDDVGQAGPVVPGCGEVNCNKVQPRLFRFACEDDVALTGDASYACKYLQESPLPIYYPKPGDFGPDTGSPVEHRLYTIGNSPSNTRTYNLGQNGWIVSPVAMNRQDPWWQDRFRTRVVGSTCYITRIDHPTYGWGQQLQLMAIKPIIHVGTLSHDGSKEVELFAQGAIVDPTPIEGAGEATFKTQVRGTKLIVTRTDDPGMGWALDLKLRARFP